MNTIKYIITLSLVLTAIVANSQVLKVDLKNKNVDSSKIEVNYTAFIDLLEIGESFQISLDAIGCFGGSKAEMKITRREMDYLVESGEKSITLANDQIEVFRGFEKKLRKIGNAYCTASDDYTLIYKNKTYRKTDSSCSWNGFMRLKQELGLKEPK